MLTVSCVVRDRLLNVLAGCGLEELRLDEGSTRDKRVVVGLARLDKAKTPSLTSIKNLGPFGRIFGRERSLSDGIAFGSALQETVSSPFAPLLLRSRTLYPALSLLSLLRILA